MPSVITGEFWGIAAIEVRLILPVDGAVRHRWVERLARRKQYGHGALVTVKCLQAIGRQGTFFFSEQRRTVHRSTLNLRLRKYGEKAKPPLTIRPYMLL